MGCEFCEELRQKYAKSGWALISKGFDKNTLVCYRCQNCGEGFCGYEFVVEKEG